MAYPNRDGINYAVNALLADPIQVYAFAAAHQRLPFNSGDLNTLQSQVQGFLSTRGYDWEKVITADDVLAYTQANGGIPTDWTTLANWLAGAKILEQISTGYARTGYAIPGQNYPPHGGAVDPPGTTYNVTPISSGQGSVGTAPAGNGETTTATAPTPTGQGVSGMFANLSQWMSQHPLEIAGAFAAYLVATGKIRLDRIL